MIECVATGLVYRNPKPHLRSLHTWHPSIVHLDDGELIATFDVAQAIESLDYRTYLARSSNDGATWTPPVRLFEDVVQRPTTHTVRMSRTADGTLLAMGSRAYRDDPEQGVVNRENLGYTPMDVIFLRSDDAGRTWQGPTTIEPPLVGPAFETCHSVVELSDGRWLWPTSTWRGWDGAQPNGMKAIAFVSHDRGETWPDSLDVMDGTPRGIVYWEQSLIELPDARLLAVAWAFNEKAGRSEPNPYALSSDGKTFGEPKQTGLHGQTAKLTRLRDGRVLCLYRRDDKPGLWANVSRIEGKAWVNEDEALVWQGAASGMTGQAAAGDELGALKFGFPSSVVLPDGEVFIVFWCCEDEVNNVRWVRLRVR